MTCRVNTKQSPFFKAFYRHNPLRLTLDSGAETNMIRETVVKSIGAKIGKSTQLARQADGLTPLKVLGETHLVLSRGGIDLHLDALVVEDLDVEVLAGTPFLVYNDIYPFDPPNRRSQLAKPLYTMVTTIPAAPSVTRFVEHRHTYCVLLLRALQCGQMTT